MKVSLTGLPDKLRGGAWPSSVRTVKRAVKSVNERDPYPMLLILSADKMHSLETATDKVEEGVGDGRSVYASQLSKSAISENYTQNRNKPLKSIPLNGWAFLLSSFNCRGWTSRK